MAGVSAVQLGYLDQAVIAFQSAININSGSVTAHSFQGERYTMNQGNPEEAIKAFNEALAIIILIMLKHIITWVTHS